MSSERLQNVLKKLNKIIKVDKERVKIARALRRANIIGEHTDYNEGYVLPCTIDRDIAMAAQPADDEVVLNSMNFDSTMRFSTTISTLILETIGKAIERKRIKPEIYVRRIPPEAGELLHWNEFEQVF